MTRIAKVLFYTLLVILVAALIRIKPATEYVGFYAGECIGACNISYEITSDKLTINEISNDSIPGKHLIIKGDFDSLRFRVPLLILSQITGRFGCPDCSDGGASTLGFKLLGMKFNYAFDRDKKPWYFYDAHDIIRDRLSKIQKIDSAYHK
ncbi:hypothetical protein HDF18_14965 [Mucilaginibacter sp. X5P1]|uniref:hypothetical protein n=1 Tax=Mucilaginibacter sp. X5P1 TaxID=2723088 RepID=UPI0016178565|nr:hypothetical protein [Mucilaginibacter sp. X5P1]MBB6138910.1 hypothetical protein [Mucilaginibacter sp. X5P1]